VINQRIAVGLPVRRSASTVLADSY
jgi:hypothetical protein